MFQTLVLILKVIVILDDVVRTLIETYTKRQEEAANAKYKKAMEKAKKQKSTLDLIDSINTKLD